MELRGGLGSGSACDMEKEAGARGESNEEEFTEDLGVGEEEDEEEEEDDDEE